MSVESKPSVRRFQSIFSDAILGASLLWTGLPETVVGKIYIASVPLNVFLFYLAIASFAFEHMIGGRSLRRPSLLLLTAALAMFLMATMGFLQGAEFRWWAIDFSMFLGLPYGFLWVGQRGIAEAARLLQQWALIFSVLLLANLAGLAVGLIPPANEGSRLFTYAVFNCTNFIAVILPCLFVAAWQRKLPGAHYREMCLAYIGAACIFLAGVFAATRSILLLSTVSVSLGYWVSTKSRMSWVAWITPTAVIGGYALLGLGASTFLVDRLRQTNLSDEDRFVEVELMFEDMAGPADYILGRGFGSRFHSSVVVDGDDRALTPHVGVLSTLYKGGAVVFTVVVVLPFVLASFQLLQFQGTRIELGFAASVVLYIVLSSMSGGWNNGLLFVYGVSIAASSGSRRKRVTTLVTARPVGVRGLRGPLLPHGQRRGRASELILAKAIEYESLPYHQQS
ncbi:hypothetical protein Poly24_09500 [Rosistilla carotiformis]|uniref:O-Antigen ligase n=1 Tax=Rosistilla carotiformis TaxID=2528017 RepID=A0A518JNY4_9BACT|nr:hypothetical protein [Rosistilla carotiformis]QDV67257.1 hypothetical protein Poly24_09500 [Rosistilla carotiformis]